MKKILIIEDHNDARFMLGQALARTRYTVLDAASGSAGLQVLRTHQPDLVLLDIGLPGGMDGFQVCEKIRNDPEAGGAFVILISGLNDEDSFAKASAAGANAYLVKPFKLSRLLEIVLGHDKLRHSFVLDRGL